MLRAIAMFVLAIVLPAKATCGESDPRVPPGRDPGGTPVAIVGAGVDYTEEGMAGRLSRDGEGEIIGYDFADDDRRPYSKEPSDVEAVGIVLGEGQATTLIAIRADAANVLTFGKALRFAGQSPAKIVLVATPHLDEKSVAMLASAAHYFRDRIFIAPTGDEARDLDLMLPQQARDVPNLLFVAGASADGRLDASANWGATTIDIATDGRALDNPFAAAQPANAPVSSVPSRGPDSSACGAAAGGRAVHRRGRLEGPHYRPCQAGRGRSGENTIRLRRAPLAAFLAGIVPPVLRTKFRPPRVRPRR